MADSDEGEEKSAISGKGSHLEVYGVSIPLGRTFRAIDKLIALPLEVAGAALERKLKKNTESHVDAVQQKRKKAGKKEKLDDPSVKTARQIYEWTYIASEVSPDDADLSALWRAILDSILEESDESEELLRIVKSLPPADIKYFFYRYGPGHVRLPTTVESEAAHTRLTAAGLLRRSIDTRMALIGFAGIFTTGLALLRGFPRSPIEASEFISNFRDVLILLAAVLVLVGVMLYNRRVPSHLGRRLIHLYAEYASPQGDKSQEKSRP